MAEVRLLKREEKAAVWAAVIAGILFFLAFPLFNFIKKFKAENQTSAEIGALSANTVIAKADAEIARLEKENASQAEMNARLAGEIGEVQAENLELKGKIGELQADLKSSSAKLIVESKPVKTFKHEFYTEREKVKNLEDQLKAYKIEVDTAKTNLSDLELKFGKLETKFDKAGENIKDLKADLKKALNENEKLNDVIASLKSGATEAKNDVKLGVQKLIEIKNKNQAELDELLAKLKLTENNLDKSEKDNEELSNLNITLKAEIEKLKAKIAELGENIKTASNQNEETEKSNEKISQLNLIITDLRDKLLEQKNTYDLKLKEQQENAKIELDKLRAKIDELLAQQKSAEAEVVKDINDLDELARGLIERLKGISDDQSKNLPRIYDNIESEGKYKLALSIPFAQSQYNAPSETWSDISDLVEKDGNAKSSYLVVGYASKEGDPEVNENISNLRAKSIAKILTNKLNNAQNVKIFYLGETSRFNNNDYSSNRKVEIWQIK